MESITHRKLGVRVEFDFYCGNGIMGAHPKYPRIKWESIISIIGYQKEPGLFNHQYGITVGFVDKGNNVLYYEVFSTSNIWEYRYFLEKTVIYIKTKYGAIGGESWCTRPEANRPNEGENNYYLSYVCCRILADKVKIGWFEQNDYEHTLVATDFINKVLISDGTEASQIWTAMEKTRLKGNKDGSFAINGSYGYDILYNKYVEMQAQAIRNGKIKSIGK